MFMTPSVVRIIVVTFQEDDLLTVWIHEKLSQVWRTSLPAIQVRSLYTSSSSSFMPQRRARRGRRRSSHRRKEPRVQRRRETCKSISINRHFMLVFVENHNWSSESKNLDKGMLNERMKWANPCRNMSRKKECKILLQWPSIDSMTCKSSRSLSLSEECWWSTSLLKDHVIESFWQMRQFSDRVFTPLKTSRRLLLVGEFQRVSHQVE